LYGIILALSSVDSDMLPVLLTCVMPPSPPSASLLSLILSLSCCSCCAARLSRLPLDRLPLATRFMLPIDADLLIDESTLIACAAKFSADANEARSPVLACFICSSQCRCIILPSSTDRLADISRKIAATISKPERCRMCAAKEAITLHASKWNDTKRYVQCNLSTFCKRLILFHARSIIVQVALTSPEYLPAFHRIPRTRDASILEQTWMAWRTTREEIEGGHFFCDYRPRRRRDLVLSPSRPSDVAPRSPRTPSPRSLHPISATASGVSSGARRGRT